MPDLSPWAALSSLDLEPFGLDNGEVATAAIVLLRTDSPNGPPGLAWVVSRGVTHWERLGMLLDALDTARAEGQDDG